MKGFWAVVRKELDRVLKDKKMIFSMFIMPIILVMGIVGLVFFLVDNLMDDVNEHVPTVYMSNAPEEFKTLMSGVEDMEIEYITDQDITEIKQGIKDGEIDLMVEFPEDFSEQIASEEVKVPQVKTFYNPSEDYSLTAREKIMICLEQYRMGLLANKFGSVEATLIFTVDTDNKEAEIQDEDKAMGKVLGMMVPYFITMMIFASAMGLGVDSIAGEKERGTLASLLLSPVSRVQIVLGKVVSLAILSVMSALVYIISMVSVFGVGVKYMGESDILGGFSFSAVQVLQLIILIIGVVLLYVSLISIVAVLAKNVKEASTYISPLYIVVIVVGMMNMYVTGDPSTTSYMIPLYGSATAFRGIFTQTITVPQFLLAIAVTYGLAAIIIALTTKAFKSEKIMFNA